jgi:hypothetical protein
MITPLVIDINPDPCDTICQKFKPVQLYFDIRSIYIGLTRTISIGAPSGLAYALRFIYNETLHDSIRNDLINDLIRAVENDIKIRIKI